MVAVVGSRRIIGSHVSLVLASSSMRAPVVVVAGRASIRRSRNGRRRAVDSAELRMMNVQIFRWEMNEDAMATEKLAGGIRQFALDLVKLEQIVRDKMQG